MATNILSYNVNGIRAAIKKGLIDFIREENPDILCIQETKAQTDQIDLLLFKELGYHTFTYSARKKGYSGVAVLSKVMPTKYTYGMSLEKYDLEGRVIRLDYPEFTQICVYIPSGTTGTIRQDFKMKFLEDFRHYIQNIQKNQPNIIVSGDFNICHKPVDINHPERHKKSSGFLPEERAWMDQIMEDGFLDAFRLLNQEPEKYSWWSYRANSREKNLGWRIDYHLISESLKNHLSVAQILNNEFHSDHCPVKILMEF